MGQTVCVCACGRGCVCAPCSPKWMRANDGFSEAHSDWEEQKKVGGQKTQRWVLPAKVKTHATVPRGPARPAGRGDYIYAGTQVLLNTLPPSAPPRLSSGFRTPPGPVQVQMPLCCTGPWTRVRLSLTSCKTKEENVPSVCRQRDAIRDIPALQKHQSSVSPVSRANILVHLKKDKTN